MERTKFKENKKSFFNEDLLLEIFKTDGYLIVNKVAIQKLGMLPAILLGNYIDKYFYLKKKQLVQDGWFYLKHDQIMEELNLGRDMIRRHKQELIQLKILETRLEGIPAKEYIKINISQLSQAIGKSDPLMYENPIPINKYSNNKSNIISSEKKFTAKERNIKYFPLAKYLSKVIQSSKNIKHTNSQINSWANEIRKLEEENGVSFERIESALQWYKKNINNQFVPIIESGNSLRVKFQRLEDAVNRKDFVPNKDKCPNGWDFGSYQSSRVGCINCEEDHTKLARRCEQLAYQKQNND